MQRPRTFRYLALGAILALAPVTAAESAAAQPNPVQQGSWDAAAAAEYLDERQAWWLDWSVAARDHDTSCLSCHTSGPYALARPALRSELGERSMSIPEARLVTDVRKRVTLWRDVEPFYPDQTVGLPKTSESRGTEAILNALVLTTRDAAAGTLSDEARLALDHLWKLQFTRGERTGGWAWLYFDLAPWESEGAAYFGAALAAVAVGSAPGGYATSSAVAERREVLESYLLDDWGSRPAFDKVMLLWAAAELEGLLVPGQAMSIVEELGRLQRADGGWALTTLGPWPGTDAYRPPEESDGYATALTAYALLRAGVGASHATVRGALDWLTSNQLESGRWPSTSLNRQRDPESERGLMMSDAATAFAVLALTEAGRHGG